MQVIRFTNPTDRTNFETALNSNSIVFTHNLDGDIIYNSGFMDATAVSIFLDANPTVYDSIFVGSPAKALLVMRIIRLKWPERAGDALIKKNQDAINPIYDYNANLILTHDILTNSTFSDFWEDLTDLFEDADYIPLTELRMIELGAALIPMANPNSNTLIRKKIIGITNPSSISVALHTGFGQLPLPSTVLCAVRDNPSVNVNVTWTGQGYSQNTPGTYLINGRIQTTNEYYNMGNIKPQISVIVNP